MQSKEQLYTSLVEKITVLIDGEDDLISVMSTVSCELFNGFEYVNWAGFYRMVDERTLKVGPYQGSHGCLAIDINRGVCGKCAREASVQLENDVRKLPFHIACSSATIAEIVVPVINAAGEVCAVLDIDSVKGDVFDEIDTRYLLEICGFVAARYN